MAYPFLLSIVFLCLSVTLLAQASITVYNYNTQKQAQDLNYYWSILVIIGSIMGVLASGAGIFMNRGSAKAAVGSAVGGASGPPTAASLGAQLEAVKNLEQAQAEVAKALGPTVRK